MHSYYLYSAIASHSFQIYPVSDMNSIHEANGPYCLVFGQFGQLALLIDTLAYRFRRDGGETWII